MINLITIRKENYGCLIYIKAKKMYYLIEDKNLSEHFYNIEKSKKSKTIVLDYLRLNNLLSENEKFYFVDNTFTDVQIVPLEAYFDFTTKCNLKCTYCYNREFHYNNDTLNNSTIVRILNDLYDLGVMRVHLAGGEPLIDESKLFEYVSFCDSHDMILSMATNGTLINDNNSKQLLSHNLLSISVSLDSYNEKNNDELRGSGSFKKAVNGIKLLVKNKKILNSNTEICIKPVFFPNTTIEELEKDILLAIDLGVDKIKFSNPERSIYHEQGYYFNNKVSHYDLIKELLLLKERYIHLIKIDIINNPTNHCLNVGLPNRMGCIGAQELLTINPNGIITPCLMNKKNLGNYFNYKSLKDFIINSEELIDYINEIQSNKECSECKIKTQCRGGCQVRKYVEKIPFSKSDPYCPKLIKNNKKYVLQNMKHKPIYVFHSL